METGIISETKFGKTREMTMNTSVFATSNDVRKLSAALRSRFFEVQIEPYTYDEFYGITLRSLERIVFICSSAHDCCIGCLCIIKRFHQYRDSPNQQGCLRQQEL